MRPIGRNVLIRIFQDEVDYKGVIRLPDTAIAKSCEGVITLIGERCNQVKPGDWVIFSRRQATLIDIGNEPHVIVDERAIIVVLEEEEDGGVQPIQDNSKMCEVREKERHVSDR